MSKQESKLLAIDPRIFWAKERTFLAWVRTGLALMGFGFVVARFNLFLRMLQVRVSSLKVLHSGWSMGFGTFLVLLGVIVQVTAVIDYVHTAKMFKQGKVAQLKPSYLGVGIALGLGAIGLVMAWYLIKTG
jgi:putative membrane protein